MYKSITNAIRFAIDEVRNARYEANEREETDLDVFKMLRNIQDKLEEALNEVNPF